METYTMEKWSEDGTFKAAVGQEVSDEVFDEFLNCLPPHYWANGYMQVGEPYGVCKMDGKHCHTFTTFRGNTFLGHLPSLHKFTIEQAKQAETIY